MNGWITDSPASRRFPVYTRSNANDVQPDPVSPLGATTTWAGVIAGWREGNVANGAFRPDELESEGINPVCGFFNGFFYINASVVRVTGERNGVGAAGIDAAIFGNRPDTPPYVAHPDDHDAEATATLGERVGWVLSATEWPQLDEHRQVAAAARRARPDLTTLSDAQLVERARSFTAVVRELFSDHVISSSNSVIGPGILGGIVPDLMLRLMAGAGDVDSAAPSHAMWALSRLDPQSAAYAAAFADFIERFGSRGPNEWDPYSEVWETDPALPTALIDAMRAVGADGDPAVRFAAVVADREAATTEALAAIAGADEATGMVLAAQASALRFSAWRERSKTNCIMVIHEQRMALRELGRRHLDDPQLLFMLTDAELDGFIADPSALGELMAERQQAWSALWELEPPYFIEADRGIPPLESLRPRSSGAVELAASGEVLTGSPGCAGVVRGRARVILDPSDPSELQPGDILVAPNTDPSWTPLFVVAGGVVVDVGAMISHAVIVSRELGIPCAVSVVDATRRIQDGSLIEVDGGRGTVTIL